MSSTVKRRRTYDTSGRRRRADQRRRAVLDVARRRFLAAGFAATTIPSIAAEAEVSAETVYKAFGSKAGLVRAVYEDALAGLGDRPAEERADALRSSDDAHQVVREWGRLAAEVSPLVSPVTLLIRDAAGTSPELTEMLAQIDEARLVRMTFNATYLHDGRHVRDGVPLEDTADLLWTMTAPELYELLVLRRGWTPERYGAFIAQTILSTLR